MKTHSIGAGEFKTHCLQLLDQVNKEHAELIITKRGKPVAKLVPLSEKPASIYGCLKGTIIIHEDIVGPTDEQWDVDLSLK